MKKSFPKQLTLLALSCLVLLPLVSCGGHSAQNPKLDGSYSGRIECQDPCKSVEIPLFSLESQTLSFKPLAHDATASVETTSIPVTWVSEKPYSIMLITNFDFIKNEFGVKQEYKGDLIPETDGCDRPRGLHVVLSDGVSLSGSLKNGCGFSTWQRISGK